MYPHGREKCEVCCAVHDTDRTMFAIQALIREFIVQTVEKVLLLPSVSQHQRVLLKSLYNYKLDVARKCAHGRMRRSPRISPRWTPEQRCGKSFGTNFGT